MKRIALAFGVLAICGVAQAYVPPSFFIVRSLARKHAVVDEGRFKHKVSFYRGDNTLIKTLNETLVMTDAESVIIRLSDEVGNEIATRSHKLVGGRSDDIARPILYDLLLMKDSAAIFSHFRQLGLPLKTEGDLYAEKDGDLPYKIEPYVGYERYQNKIAVVVSDGTRKSASDVKTPQLWVEKDSFLPMRAVFPSAPESGVASEPLEFKFSGYQMQKGLLYPRVTEVHRKGSLWVKIETIDVQLGAGIKPEPAKTRVEIDGELKAAVEIYFKWIR